MDLYKTIKKIFLKIRRKCYLKIKRIRVFYNSVSLHSRIIFLLKIAIPSIVAIIIGIMIVLPELNNDIKRIKFSFPNLNTIKQISFDIDNGSFYGQSKNDIIFSVNINKITESVKTTKLFNISGNIFFANNRILYFKTDNGSYQKINNNFMMNKDIYISDYDSNEIYTDEVIINLDTMNIFGNKLIKLKSNLGTIIGDGFNIKDNKIYKFTGKIKGYINI